MNKQAIWIPTLFIACAACATTHTTMQKTTSDKVAAPVAERIAHTQSLHGEERVDHYFWLREKENPKTIAYLNAENSYTESQMAHTQELQETLYEEMLGRIVEDDTSVPYRKDEYFYYTRTEEGKPYRIYCRKKGNLDAQEEILLDVNLLGEGKEYVDIGVFAVSPNHQLLAYSVDESGYERFTLRFKDLTTGKLLPDTVENTYYALAWANDNKTVFYDTVDEANRPYRLNRHTLGQAADTNPVIYEEKDDRFFLSVDRSLSGDYLFMSLGSAVTSEVHSLPAATPDADWQVIQPRAQEVEYSVVHHGEHFYILTNDEAMNFKLVRAPTGSPHKDNWETVLAHDENVTLSGVTAFKDHLVIYERSAGLPQLRIVPVQAPDTAHRIAFSEASYDVWPNRNAEFDTTTFRFGYTSMLTPRSIFDYDLNTRTQTLKKENPVRNYDRSKYTTERVFATAKDGTQVPVSVLRKKDSPLNGEAPMLLYGYGSYGYPYDASFRSSWFSLVDRGLTIGIAHIRGGGEYGRRWKLDGKLEKKMNTFTDFIACAEHLIKAGYTQADRLAIEGRSAGGLLMGAVMNLRPDLFRAVVAGVPFVDVVNTMLDETIPLTVIEWEEWGNPNNEKDYKTILAYSPYDNIEAKAYPSLLVVAGLNDPRVHYWEPAKFTAKLRVHKTDANPLLLKTNMGAGHGGASGRYGRLKEIAFEYAFVLDQVSPN